MPVRATDENFELRVAELCPNSPGKITKTSPRDRNYNCFAWAVNDTSRPWIPGGDPETSRWPPGASGSLALASVVASLEQLGFVEVQAPSPDPRSECIALLVDGDGDVVHAARLLGNGRWTSKLGQWEDIEHADLATIEGGDYGKVATYLER